jgi:hypothetical protein
MTAPKKAFQFIADCSVVVLVVKAGVLLIARNSLPVRPFRKEKGHQRSRPMRPPKPIITSTRGGLIRRFRRVDDLNIDRPREFALRTSNDPS